MRSMMTYLEASRFKALNVMMDLEDEHKRQSILRVDVGSKKITFTRSVDDVEKMKLVLDEEGEVVDVVSREHLAAHSLVEECMLAANVAAARCLKKFKLPTLYRIHEGPSDERLAALRQFLGSMALGLGGGVKPEPSDYQSLLEQAHGRPDFALIQAMILRSMQQAKYAPDPDIGHFGLSYDHYTHFTSPIRRYPDLLVHRAIRSLVRGGKFPKQTRRSEDAQKPGPIEAYLYSRPFIRNHGTYIRW